MNKLLFTFVLLVPIAAFSQNCDCESNFNWVKQTFEENDAGFTFAIDNKGEEAYKEHNEEFLERIKNIENSNECAGIIYEWLSFFRSGHFGIRMINQTSGEEEAPETNEDAIRSQFKDSESLDVDLGKFNAMLESKKEADYEGIWVADQYRIGVKKVDEEYIGFVIEADGVYWTEGQVKFKIHADNSATYYMRDHSAQEFLSTELLGNNYLQMGFMTFERVVPHFPANPEIGRYFKAVDASEPYFELIDDQTTYIRIPTFASSEKIVIDSVINANRDVILKTPNLIIDIRNNGGGSDRSYKELLPFMYTNPIRTMAVEMYSTPLNNQRMLDFISDPKYAFDKEEKVWAQESYDVLSTQIGEFVNLDSNDVDITTYDSVLPFPNNIGIVINENNGSTAEQFLLAAKQSSKVKLYGVTTRGVLDISNMYFVKSPCEEFELGYCLSRSMRIPEMAIDDKGIQPDFYIDNSIPMYKWLEFVRNSMEGQ